MSLAIWWIRRDLRLTDNTALHAALSDHELIAPVYILDPALLKSGRNADGTHGPRIAWMLDGLRALDTDLRAIGSRLIVRHGQPRTELPALAKQIGAAAVYFNRDYSPYALKRDSEMHTLLEGVGIAAHDFKDLVVHEATETLSQAGQPFSVYSPYRKAWNALPKPSLYPAPQHLHTPETIDSMAIPTAADFGMEAAAQPITEASEAAARKNLAEFMAAPIYDYADNRNSPALDGSSIMSPYLRWGMISPRTAFDAAQHALSTAPNKDARDGVDKWIGELVWREFYYQVLARNPHVTRGAFRPMYDALQYENGQDVPALLTAWQTGQTGYPIVDAAMRQMNATGWMHNRCRMLTASFLCKDLLIDWKIGERYFMQRLLDGDLACNNGGWQWTAGVGTDAAPYFRVFNPATQAVKFDPDGAYVRRWLPELRNVPNQYIHEPHTMPDDVQQAAGCIVGRDYPAPLVDHSVQRDRVLKLFDAVRAANP